jgi:maltooligosyltrehalose trehalohydrolase
VHRTLLALRKAHPELVDPDLAAVEVRWDDDARWLVLHRGSLRVVANLADVPREVELDRVPTGVLFATGQQPTWSGCAVTLPAASAAVLR